MAAPHVGIFSIISMCFTLLICFGVPIGLAIWAKVRYKKAFSFLPLLGGALGFFVSQEVFRLPIVQSLLPSFGWYKSFMQMTWPYLIFMCFTAGLVEEPARFIAFSIMKKRREYVDGLSYGIGHGGIEAVLITGMMYVNNILISTAINSGVPNMLGVPLPDSVVTAMVATPAYMFLVAGIERIFAVTLHIALSLVVLKGFQTGRKWLFLLLSFLLHGSANFITIAAAHLGTLILGGQRQLWSILFSEGSLLLIAILCLWFIAVQARNWRTSHKPIEGALPDGQQGQADPQGSGA